MKTESLVINKKGKFDIVFTLNGRRTEVEVSACETLLETLRSLGYKGSKKGCDTGDCGSCAVIFNGKAKLSCLLPAFAAHGGEVITIEGIGSVSNPHPIQRAFVEAGAVQCGYCIPGMIVSTKTLLDKNPNPCEEEIKHALDGNLCRCTGYVKQVEAVKLADKKLAKQLNRR